MDENIECENKECRLWIDYKEEYNCSLISIYEHGSMTLRQVAERLGISFARVKQLESRALEKLKKRSGVRDILF
jgi:DNA-directed RNA polymerase sigma subunit (sigma70/sigma32)